MLCRALCAVAAVSYVLCLLVLSGVQKDDLDAATLRKLQRHNVNIADNDGKLREQCLVKHKTATSSSTTEQMELKIDHDRSTSQPAANVLNTAAELKKILNYFKEKETQREINIKEQSTQTNFILNGNFVDLSKLPSSVQGLVLKEIEDSRTETRINRIANKDNERLTLAHDDNDLQNIEKVQQERSSKNPNKKRTENPNDLEYISKIVAQILAQRQTTTSPPPTTNFDRSKLAQDIHSMLANDLIKTFPQNLYLNNLNLTDVLRPNPVELKNNGEKDIIVALLDQLNNRNSLSNPYLPGMKKNTNLDDDQDDNGLSETKSREGRGRNNIILNNRNDNKPVLLDNNRNVPTVNGQFLSKWQNVNVDGDKNSLKAGIAGTNVRCIIFSHPNDPCNIQNDNEFHPNEANRSLWSFIIDGLSKGELKIQDVQKISSMYWPTDYKVKPNIKNDLSLDNNFKTEWLLNSRTGDQFQFKGKYRQSSANEPLRNNDLEGQFNKNTWNKYYENPTVNQQYEFDRNKLLQVSNGKSEYNHRLTSNDEDLPQLNQFKNQEKLSDSVLPIKNTNKDSDLGRTYKSNKLHASGKEDIEKPKSMPAGMIKEIADSVKELLLRDLKKELSTSAASTMSTTVPTTAESTTTSSTTTTSTTTPATTQTTSSTVEPTTTKTQTITTTTEKLSTTVKVDPLNIQEASKALEKFMEVFEKFKSIKDSIITPENITNHDKANNNNVIIKEVNRELRLSYPKPYDIRSQIKRPNPQILDPYSDPTTPDPVKYRSSKKPPGFALTLQTNSHEIQPLSVAVSRPLSIYNTIVVTPLPARQRSRNLHQRRYSVEPRYRKPERYQIERTESQSGFSPSKGSNRDTSKFKYVSRVKPRNKKERNFKDRGYKSRGLHGVEKFHEKLERADDWQRYGPGEKCSGSKENCNEPVAPRKQRPLVNTGHSYDDTHFRNFLKTQQKVTDMLEKILATNTKHNPRSAEVI